MSNRKNLFLKALKFCLVLVLAAGVIPATPASAGGKIRPKTPKNIIIMISDGMGYNHTLAASYYRYGKAGKQVYNSFPFKYGMSTYPGAESLGAPAGDRCFGWGYDPSKTWSDFTYLRTCPTDSASAATAMSTGVKTYNAGIGVDLYGMPARHILQMLEEYGRSTGVVTTVEFSHATPAGFVAHNQSRNNYEDIAKEMIYDSAVDVIMGTGNPWFDDNGAPKTTPNNYRYVGGEPTWNELNAGTAGNDADGDGDADAWVLIQTQAEFQSLTQGATPERVIGVPQVYTTLQQARTGDALAAPFVTPLNQNVPTLAEMTLGALNVLDEDPDGLFLMVEGGAVDWASHANQSGRTIEEQIDFDLAVEAVMQWVKANSSWSETLLIVTGDHETGYLLGLGSNPTFEPLVNHGKGALPGMQWNSGDHTNSLIPFYARGIGARWFKQAVHNIDPVRGAYIDNTLIANVIFQLFEPAE